MMWSEVWTALGKSSVNNSVSVQDHGLLVGDGVFETLQTQAGRVLSLQRHLARMQKSAEIVGFPLVPLAEIEHAISNLRSQHADFSAVPGRLRITLTSGAGEMGSARGDDWTLLITWMPATAWPESARVQTSKVVRFSRAVTAGAKTTSYIDNVIALQAARATGYDEAILKNEHGWITEGTGSNVFFIQGDSVLTPALSLGALGGITRQVLMQTNPEIIEAEIALDDVFKMDAVFLTSSTRNLQPVRVWDHHEFPAFNAIFNRLQGSYMQEIETEWT